MNEPVIQPKRSRKKFNNAFKQQAVELWLNSGKTATEVAAELGIHSQRPVRLEGRLRRRPRGRGGGAKRSNT